MRVAIAGIHHETNTFSPVGADSAAFARAGVLRGAEIVASLGASNSMVAGFLRCCEERGAESVPLLYAEHTPCGEVSDEAFAELSGEIVARLRGDGPFDVVLLAQHGAAVGTSQRDLDGELLARVRAAVGPDVVVAMALDLHANVSERMIAAADVVVGYRENPHRDADLRAYECAALALAAAAGTIRPVQALRRLPMVVPILGGWTAEGAMREVLEESAAIAAAEGLLSHTVFHGFGYADVAELGSSVLAVADGDPEVAERAAERIAACLWARREDLDATADGPAAALASAERLAGPEGPVVLLDVGDNIGGGSPGDSTVILDEALRTGVEGLVASVWDEDAAQAGVAAGVGAEVELSVGAKTAVSVGPALQLRGKVAAVSDGRFEDPNPTHAGALSYDGGPTVRLSDERGCEVLITSRALASHSPEQLRDVGLDPRAQRLVVAKGVVAPRAGYERIGARFVLVDTPGITTADLDSLGHTNRPRPLWPFEKQADGERGAAA